MDDAARIALLNEEIVSMRADLDAQQEAFLYLCKWVERGLFDKQTSARTALECIAYHPGMPWQNGRWDVDHKPYARAFYTAFPKAIRDGEKN